jgi:hypothetical protein
MTYAWLHNPKLRPADLILTKRLSTLICNPLVFRTVGIYHHESCVIMIITRPLAKLFGGLVLLSAAIFIIVAFNERETARVLLLKTTHSLLATLQGGRDIEATCPQTHVDYFAETALSISFFTFLVSTFGTVFTVLVGWKSDREFKLKIVQLEAQVVELKHQRLKAAVKSGD